MFSGCYRFIARLKHVRPHGNDTGCYSNSSESPGNQEAIALIDKDSGSDTNNGIAKKPSAVVKPSQIIELETFVKLPCGLK